MKKLRILPGEICLYINLFNKLLFSVCVQLKIEKEKHAEIN